MNHNSGGAGLLRPAIKKEMVTAMHIFLILFSIVSYVADFVLDIILAINHFTDGNTWFFAQTVCSITIPALILTGFNIWWYKADAKTDSFKVSTKLQLLRILFIILLMAPLLRNFEALYYAIKSIKGRDAKEKETCYKRMISFITDAAILSVFEAFMESGPQVVLQTCIFAQLQASNPNVFTVTEIWQMVSIFVSLFSMSAAYATYQRSLRFSLNDRGKLNIPTLLFLVIWRFLDITSRVIALGLFASVFPYYLIFICCVHFIAMFSWIRVMKTDFCENV